MNIHYFIEDISNKKKALERNKHPHWMNDSIQFDLNRDKTVYTNIQSYDIKTGKESNLSVLIPIKTLTDAVNYLNEKAILVE